MKKTIKYSILGLAALCTVVLCGGYYMLGHAPVSYTHLDVYKRQPPSKSKCSSPAWE